RELQGTHVRRTHPRHEGNDRTLGAADRGARDTHRRRFRARQDHRPEGPPLTPELLWTRFPYLWHMAEPGSWPAIRDHGLLSTSALLDRYGIMGEARDVFEAKRRPECLPLRREGLPDVMIRDQKPMSDDALETCLDDGLTPADWYRILNARTFFWLSQARLRKLLRARAYRNRPQTVLTLNTRSLVEVHAERIELSPINSGATLYGAGTKRGRRTFLPIAEYDFEGWSKKRGTRGEPVVELVVRDGVPDIREHVVAVHDWENGANVEVWRRPGADSAIGP